MANDWGDVRPAILSSSSVSQLDEFRRFRHLVRNIYSANLQPERMNRLLSDLPELWRRLQAELLAYADLLSEIEGA